MANDTAPLPLNGGFPSNNSDREPMQWRRHLIFKTDQMPLYKRNTTHLIYTQVRFHIEAHKPRPGCALVVCVISLHLRTDIVGIISPTLRAQRTQTFRSQQFFCHNIQVPASSVPYPMENSQKQQQISYWDERSNPSYNRLHNQTDSRTHYEKLPQTIFLLFLPEHPMLSAKNVISTLTHNV